MKADTAQKAGRKESKLSHKVRATFLSLALIAMAGCGGGGGESGAPAGVTPAPVQPAVSANTFTVTSDNYGLENATYLSSTKSSLGIVLRAAIASSLTDPGYKTVSRIDIASGAAITPNAVYSLGGAGNAFPGNVYFFNGHQSTLLRTVGGTITFTRYGGNAGDRVSGSFNALVEDGNDPARPSYSIAASFDLVTDSFGAVQPAPAYLALSAQPSYQANCASCHALGSYDPTTAGASDLALKGGRVDALFTAGQAGHQGISLTANEIITLKVLLNTN